MEQNPNRDHFHAHRRSTDKERMKILGWLSSVAHHEKHTDTLRRRHENTGMWFLELAEFQDWLKNDTKNVLWCKGDPGVGKTILAYVSNPFHGRSL
jgi:Cdc6-like AAA superfamily ATPase